ncbi:NAD(P)H-quinone oxidoreductase [Arcanobacterium ihumii]|uniref:NAD(P)H-quinone oxidoreductase n=1 Tax=Arcanobacterium ihumii TaxID=2138162 RepID=UPI000F539890|nr:NAD(P)H-quinone oxidoreductase [Arcanobacterium ihumii]
MKVVKAVNNHLVFESAPIPIPGHNEIRIRVVAAGVNRADLLQAEGKYPPPAGASDILGLEVSGVVDAVGQLDPHLKKLPVTSVGTPVAALLQGGGYAEYVVVNVQLAYLAPANLSLIEAASFPEAFATAYSNLVMVGGLFAGKRTLIHGGSGGVGSHAIQIASAFGAEVFATAGSEDRARKLLSLGAHHVTDYHAFTEEKDLCAWIMKESTTDIERSKNPGIDVVLDVMGESTLDANIRTLADGGRIVIIGTQGGTRPTFNLTRLMARRGSIIGTTLRSRHLQDRIEVQQRVGREIVPLVECGKIRPVIDRVYAFDEVQEAHDALGRGEVFGKVLLKVQEGEE